MRSDFADDFDAFELDADVWLPHYLPQWSSRAESAATYAVGESELRLTVPPEHGLWCARDHEPPLRVSGLQSGVFSGPVGSTVGQQPFRDGLVVRESQPAHWGWTPHHGRLEVRARMELSPRSMASVSTRRIGGTGGLTSSSTASTSRPSTRRPTTRCR